jgi:hypothetical protein
MMVDSQTSVILLCLTTFSIHTVLTFQKVVLPPIKSTELKLLEAQVEEESNVLDRCTVTVNHFAALTFFAERGAVGGHVYQPNVNHRIMNFENLGSKRTGEDDVVVTPLLRSMINNEGKSSFSGNTTIRLFPYEIVASTSLNDRLSHLMSPAPLAFDIAPPTEVVTISDEDGSENEEDVEEQDVVTSPPNPGGKTAGSANSTLSSCTTPVEGSNGVPTSVMVPTAIAPVEDCKPTAEPPQPETPSAAIPRKVPMTRQMLMGSIEGVRAQRLSGRAFDRLLELFGVHRKAKGSNDVTAIEIASFFNEIASINIGTIEQLSAFLKRFKLDRFYELDSKPVHQQLKSIGTIIRALSPFRLSVYDGRHRFNLCCYFATGIFYPTSDLRPPAISFEDVKKMFSEPGDEKSSFETTELFLKQVVSIASSKPEVKSWAAISASMKSFGQETQRLQQLTVKMTCSSLITEFVNEFETTDLFLNTKPLGFEFWAHEDKREKHPKIPYKEHVEAFLQFIYASVNTRGPLFKGLVRNEWKDIAKICYAVGSNLNYPLGYTSEIKPPNGMSNNLGIMVTLLKYLGPNPRNYNELRKFANQNKWLRTQKEVAPEDHKVLKSLGFLKQAVMDNVLFVANHCEQKYIVEKKVLDWARAEKGNPDLAKDLQDGYPRFPRCEKGELDFAYLEDRRVTDVELDLKSTKMTSKLHFACVCTLLADALSWYNRNGPNPGVGCDDGSSNQAVHLYLE